MLGLHRDINVTRNFLSSRSVHKPWGHGARPGVVTNHVQSHGLCSTDLKDQGEPFNQCRFDPTAHVHLRGLYKQAP